MRSLFDISGIKFVNNNRHMVILGDYNRKDVQERRGSNGLRIFSERLQRIHRGIGEQNKYPNRI